MPIYFVPPRGRILICDFDMACVPPEMAKERRVVVVSPRSYNRRHGAGPGRCLVVPFSSAAPVANRPCYVPFAANVYASLTEETWAYCDALSSVSHARLTPVRAKGKDLFEDLTPEDVERIAVGLRHAIGIA
ncbi:type II toxin-antitoxin system PemK/MazF family toxin [Mesorhizobium sp. M0968]|uniref:type II toxin-antitoxin system PemK/MazF family toxin n=1 Tax=Mesorhizobium sp. M0968 TaxID=2957037 RepID=UPI00333BDA02